MTRSFIFGALLFVSSIATVSHADAAVLDATYGNRDGCLYAKTGESSGSDDFFLLNDDGVTTATAYCAFNDTLKKKAKGFTAKATCNAEGETDEQAENIDILAEKSGYTIAFTDGTRWGPLAKCRK